MNISHEVDSKVNVSPQVSCGVLECAVVVLQIACLRFCNELFGVDYQLIKQEHYFCQTLYNAYMCINVYKLNIIFICLYNFTF